jgi:hypothetical protein
MSRAGNHSSCFRTPDIFGICYKGGQGEDADVRSIMPGHFSLFFRNYPLIISGKRFLYFNSNSNNAIAV